MIIKRLKARRVPIVMSIAILVVGMIQSFFLFRLTAAGVFGQTWAIPGDIWWTYFTAHWIVSQGYGSLYSSTGQFITMPGIALLLAPVSMLTQALGLTQSGVFTMEHPSAWLVLGPFEMLTGSLALFGLDALAQRLLVEHRRRRFICVIEGLLLYQVTAIWGHPEDAIAVGFAAYAIVSTLDGRPKKSAWLLGAGIAFQPLVILVLPLLIGRAGLRKALPVIERAIGPSVALLIIPFATDFRATWRAVVEQPNELPLVHVTLWTRFAPVLAKGIVSCGPMRLVAVVGTFVLGYLVFRLRGRFEPTTLTWLAGVCLALRFVTESAVAAYYIWPALAMFVLASVNQRKDRLNLSCALAIALTVESNVDFTRTWLWWGVAVLGLVLLAVSSMPPDLHRVLRRTSAPTSGLTDCGDTLDELFEAAKPLALVRVGSDEARPDTESIQLHELI
jgi:hypothetical protein